MSIGACVGIKDALAASRLANGNADNYQLNQYIGKSFYEGENFRAVIECLDEGKFYFIVLFLLIYFRHRV